MVIDKRRNWKLFIIIFAIVNLFLSSFFLDIWTSPNSASRALTVLAFSESKTLKINKYENRTMDKSKVGNDFYSDKAPLPTLLAIPFYEFIKGFGINLVNKNFIKKYPVYIYRYKGFNDSRQFMMPEIVQILLIGDLILSSFPFALMVLLTFFALHRIKPNISPILMVMLAFYGSFIFVFAGTFFNHVLAGFFLLLSYIYLKRRKYFLSGIFLGMSFLCEYPVIIAAPIWFLLILIKERKIKLSLFFASGVLPSIIFISIYNFLITGSPFKMLNAYHAFEKYKALSHNYGFSFPSLDSLWGLSFSGSMGLFVFAPVLFIVAFYIILSFLKDKTFKEKLKTNYIAVFSILFFLVIASFFTWWGGCSYGPRYLIVIAVPLIYEGLIFISKFKMNTLVFIGVTFFGIISSWYAKSTLVYFIPDYFRQSSKYSNTFFHILSPEFSEKRFNANNFMTAILNVKPEIGVYFWLFLFIVTLIIFYFWYNFLFPTLKKDITKVAMKSRANA